MSTDKVWTDPGDQTVEPTHHADPSQPDLFTFTNEQANEGVARRDAALDLHEETRPSYLEQARAYVRALAQYRPVDADDVRLFCDEEGIPRGKWMGAVFRGREWEHIGWKRSRDPVQNATGLRVWRLRR